jgi:hypothetical protein
MTLPRKAVYGALLVAGILLLVVGEADAREGFHLLELSEVRVEYKRFHESARDPLFYDTTPKEELNLRMDMDVLSYGDVAALGWHNRIHSMTNASQYYVVGYNFQLGVFTKRVEFGYEHFSRHLLDHSYPHQKFPVLDSLFFNLIVYKRDER